MKFTPGPWSAKTITNDHGGWEAESQEVTIGNADQNVLIAQYNTDFNEYPSDEENEANARLIAKAPEMYEVIKRYLGPPTIILQELDDKAEALIAEIEGD